MILKFKLFIAKYVNPDLEKELKKETLRRKELEEMLEKILYNEKLKLPTKTTLDIFECLHKEEN